MPDIKANLYELVKEYCNIHNLNASISSTVTAAILVIPSGTDYAKAYVNYRVKTSSYKKQSMLYEFFCEWLRYDSIPISKFLEFLEDRYGPKIELKLEIWDKNKIRYAYLQKNYFNDSGTLGRSCMRHTTHQKALNFYIQNDLQIVVLIDENKKIHSRAMLWDDVKSIGKGHIGKYLDRVYSNSSKYMSRLQDYAKEQGWRYYPSESAGEGDKHLYKIDINLDGITHVPYLDTFRHLFHLDKVLLGSKDYRHEVSSIKNPDEYIKVATGDIIETYGYHRILDPNSVKEKFTHKYISKKDATYVKQYDGYVLKEHIVDIGGKYYSQHDKTIMQSPIDGWILTKDAVQEHITHNTIDKTKAVKLDKYDDYIHKSNVIVINEIQYHKADPEIIEYSGKHYHLSQCFTNYNIYYDEKGRLCADRTDNPIPKSKAIVAYTLLDRINNADLRAMAQTWNTIIQKTDIGDFYWQQVYFPESTPVKNFIILSTGEYIVENDINRKYVRRFNKQYYLRTEFNLPDKKQLALFE